jgi:hypothetical protein
MDVRGNWTLKSEIDTHVFDESLCNAIVTVCDNRGIISVVDIGCGNGSYTEYILKNGIDCSGFDGSPLTPELSGYLCGVKDFSRPQNIGKYGLVLSLEVGEHIPKEYEQIFLDNLVNAAIGLIVLSWAVVGQGGDGHVNCQNNDYVIQQMEDRGFFYDLETTDYLRNKCSISWFKNTILAFEL